MEHEDVLGMIDVTLPEEVGVSARRRRLDHLRCQARRTARRRLRCERRARARHLRRRSRTRHQLPRRWSGGGHGDQRHGQRLVRSQIRSRSATRCGSCSATATAGRTASGEPRRDGSAGRADDRRARWSLVRQRGVHAAEYVRQCRMAGRSPARVAHAGRFRFARRSGHWLLRPAGDARSAVGDRHVCPGRGRDGVAGAIVDGRRPGGDRARRVPTVGRWQSRG